jgi:transcriptional regulator with XRE-family HTH domain
MTDHVGAFGARLRTCRQAAGLSQEELAARSGLSVRTIRDLERGRTRWPYQDSLHRLADALELRGDGRGDFIAAAGRRLEHIPPVAAGRLPAAEPRRAGGARIVPRYLPTTVPAFVGRDDQLAALSQVLHQPGGTAIITAIGGTAGVGKPKLEF